MLGSEKNTPISTGTVSYTHLDVYKRQLLVVAAFVLPALGLGALDGLRSGGVPVAMYVLGFLFYLVQYFVIFFFNSALVGAALIRLDGGDPTLRDGLRIASSKWVSILGYAAVAATVGLILRSLQERAGWLGRIVVGFLGCLLYTSRCV